MSAIKADWQSTLSLSEQHLREYIIGQILTVRTTSALVAKNWKNIVGQGEPSQKIMTAYIKHGLLQQKEAVVCQSSLIETDRHLKRSLQKSIPKSTETILKEKGGP